MEIIRLTTWIAAPEERCFRLATCAAFHEALAKGAIKRPPKDLEEATLAGGDQLIWPGHRAGMQLKYTSRIAAIRPTGYFREALVASRHFSHLEHDHHFTTLNDGTRVRDELHYSLMPPGPAGLLLGPLVRRYLISKIALRNQILKAVAESDLWHRYLCESGKPVEIIEEPAKPGSSRTPNSAAPDRLPKQAMVEHRG